MKSTNLLTLHNESEDRLLIFPDDPNVAGGSACPGSAVRAGGAWPTVQYFTHFTQKVIEAKFAYFRRGKSKFSRNRCLVAPI
jgi:hypothetical protein